MNYDSDVNVLDMVPIADHILGIYIIDDDLGLCAADLNADGIIDIIDLSIIVSYMINSRTPASYVNIYANMNSITYQADGYFNIFLKLEHGDDFSLDFSATHNLINPYYSSSNSTDLIILLPQNGIFGTIEYGEEYGAYQITEAIAVVGDEYIDNVEIYQYNPSGDLNSDTTLDVLDIVLMVETIIDSEFVFNGDLNDDNFVDILDIILLVNIIINMPESFYDEGYLVLTDGIIDDDALTSLGITDENGYFEFNQKTYFPTFYSSLTYQRTDDQGNNDLEPSEFTLNDLTTGNFNILLFGDNLSFEINDIEIIDGLNQITINQDGSYQLYQEVGDFSLQFFIFDNQGLPMDDVSVKLQYVCNSEGGIICFDYFSFNRPSAAIPYKSCSDSSGYITIYYLDGTLYQSIPYDFEAGNNNFIFSLSVYDNFSAGLQVFKYAVTINNINQGLCESNPMLPSEYSLEYPYPNPFN